MSKSWIIRLSITVFNVLFLTMIYRNLDSMHFLDPSVVLGLSWLVFGATYAVLGKRFVPKFRGFVFESVFVGASCSLAEALAICIYYVSNAIPAGFTAEAQLFGLAIVGSSAVVSTLSFVVAQLIAHNLRPK